LVATLDNAEDTKVFKASCHDTVQAIMLTMPPSLVVADAAHPEGRALVAAARMHCPHVKVIVLAMREWDEEFLAWAEIGISGYLGPDTSARDILSAVRRVGAGEVVLSSRQTALMLNRSASGSRPRATGGGLHELTSREREVAALVAEGMSNKLIAQRLGFTAATAKNHVHRILDKLDARSRGEAAARYRQQTHVAPERRS
jgi:DNA-binding NarL/FixJ family response regulator